MKPQYSGITSVEACLPLPSTDQTHPELSALVGKGNLMSFGDGKGIVAQRNPGDIRAYCAVTVPESWPEDNEFDWSDAKTAKQQFLQTHYADWSPLLQGLFLESEDQIRLWPLYGLPKPSEGGGWTHKEGLTLVGDAAHVMPPWSVCSIHLLNQTCTF